MGMPPVHWSVGIEPTAVNFTGSPLEGGEALTWLLPLLTPQILLTGLGLLLALLLLAAGAGMLAFRKATRHPALGRAVLALRAEYEPPGVRRDVIQLRLQLQEAVGSARLAVSTLVVHGGGLARDLPELVGRLEAAAARLDAQLRLIESDPADQEGPLLVRAARVRTDELVALARRVRRTAGAALGGVAETAQGSLASDIDRELVSLQAGLDALAELNQGDHSSWRTDPPPRLGGR